MRRRKEDTLLLALSQLDLCALYLVIVRPHDIFCEMLWQVHAAIVVL
jgi:hypothetical protein